MSDGHIPYETIGRFLDRRIDRDERESVERHLKDCELCRRDVEDARQWRGQLGGGEPATGKGKAALLLSLAVAVLGGALLAAWYFLRR